MDIRSLADASGRSPVAARLYNFHSAMEPHETRIRARYAETDQMGVVHHANYLVWMEVARVEFSLARGFHYREMEAGGVMMVVAEAHLRYAAPARFDDEVVVETWIEEAKSRMVRFGYRIRDCRGRELVSGETKHIFCGRDFKPCRMPDRYRAAFGLPAPVG
jgi:acyl-CoA thioester hydrolase